MNIQALVETKGYAEWMEIISNTPTPNLIVGGLILFFILHVASKSKRRSR